MNKNENKIKDVQWIKSLHNEIEQISGTIYKAIDDTLFIDLAKAIDHNIKLKIKEFALTINHEDFNDKEDLELFLYENRDELRSILDNDY